MKKLLKFTVCMFSTKYVLFNGLKIINFALYVKAIWKKQANKNTNDYFFILILFLNNIEHYKIN